MRSSGTLRSGGSRTISCCTAAAIGHRESNLKIYLRRPLSYRTASQIFYSRARSCRKVPAHARPSTTSITTITRPCKSGDSSVPRAMDSAVKLADCLCTLYGECTS